MRQAIGSLKLLRPVTPNHNEVLSPDQSLSVYSSGILDKANLKMFTIHAKTYKILDDIPRKSGK